VADLTTAMNAQPALEQAVEDRAVDVTDARTALRTAATHVDRLNKRFFAKLEAEARTNPALAEALAGITTGAKLPGTLGIVSILQGGVNGLQLLVSYENGTYTTGATSTIEWMVDVVDADFTQHSTPADPSVNALGPFTVGQVVKLRTRVTNASGTTTGSIRTLTILNPAGEAPLPPRAGGVAFAGLIIGVVPAGNASGQAASNNYGGRDQSLINDNPVAQS
jgi:hypothetical protein